MEIDNKIRRWTVYLHTIPKEVSNYNYDKYYVGLTGRKDPEIRWDKGRGYEKQLFHKAIEKYGWNNITHEILFTELTELEAVEKEAEMIKQYDSIIGHKGYNVSPGGVENYHLHGNKNRTHPIVYLNNGMCFRSITLCGEYVGENQEDIRRRAKNNPNGCYQKRINCNSNQNNKYCFLEDYWKYYQQYHGCRGMVNAHPIVHLQTKKLFLGYRNANKELNINIHGKAILDIDKYIDLDSRGKLYNKDRYMYSKDFFLLYDNTEPCYEAS